MKLTIKLFLMLFLSAILISCMDTHSAHYQPIQDPFVEVFGGGKANRYMVKNLTIAGKGNKEMTNSGGSLAMELEFSHYCPECGDTRNQIIVGIAGEDKAQVCIWSGSQSSDGWQKGKFSLSVPDQKGIYYIRTRYAQAYDCNTALGWWKIDRPTGPTEESNIGYVEIK